MKLPKGWTKIDSGWYERSETGRFIQAVRLSKTRRWLAHGEGRTVGPFKTAREAFAALGVEV